MGARGGSSAAPRGGRSCRCHRLHGHGQYWMWTGRWDAPWRCRLSGTGGWRDRRAAGEEPAPRGARPAAAPLPPPRRILCLCSWCETRGAAGGPGGRCPRSAVPGLGWGLCTEMAPFPRPAPGQSAALGSAWMRCLFAATVSMFLRGYLPKRKIIRLLQLYAGVFFWMFLFNASFCRGCCHPLRRSFASRCPLCCWAAASRAGLHVPGAGSRAGARPASTCFAVV